MERTTIGLQKVAQEMEQVPERQSQEQCPTPSPLQAEKLPLFTRRVVFIGTKYNKASRFEDYCLSLYRPLYDFGSIELLISGHLVILLNLFQVSTIGDLSSTMVH